MVDITILIAVLAIFCAALSLVMLFAKDALSCALALLGILLGTAGIYALEGEHFVATAQLVVYAGAIMVLFVFSIMLLNMRKGEKEFSILSLPFIAGGISMLVLVGAGSWVLVNHVVAPVGPWNFAQVQSFGGNTRVLSLELFSHHTIAFEAIALAILVAMVGAVTLAKRKVD